MDERWFHMKVLDVNVFPEYPLPLARDRANLGILLYVNLHVVDSWANLKRICVEVYLGVDSQRLVLIILNVDLLCYEVESW